MKKTIGIVCAAAILFGSVMFTSGISQTINADPANTVSPVAKNPMIATAAPPTQFSAVAVNGAQLDEDSIAERLYYLGILSGSVDEDGRLTFETSRELTRLEAAVMIVRLLGAEEEAQSSPPVENYKDVPEWGKPYVDYLYTRSLTDAANTVYFNPNKPINANAFMKYVLYALGYSYGGEDFGGKLASFVGEELGICEGSFYEITRGEAMSAVYRALNTNLKGTDKLFSEKLVDDGKLDYNDAVFLLWSDDPATTDQYMILSGYEIGKMLPDGYYSITDKESGYLMNVLASGSNTDYEGVGVTLWENTDDITQSFRLERTERGTYMIYAACSRGGYNRVLGFDPQKGTAALYHSTSPNSQEFYIRSADEGGWYIIPASRPFAAVGKSAADAGSAVVLSSEDYDKTLYRWELDRQGAFTDKGDEIAVFPSETLQISQGPYDGFSHKTQNAIDLLTANGRAFAPFTGTVVRTINSYEGCNAVWLQSNSKVVYADGTVDYMTVVFLHDNYIGDLHVGQVIRQGEYFYDMGTMGYATGRHIHLYCIRGAYSPYLPFTGSGDVYVNDAFCLLPETAVIDSGGMSWKISG